MRARPAADDRCRPAEGGRGRLSHFGVINAGSRTTAPPWFSIRARGGAVAGQPAGLRSQQDSRSASTARPGSLCSPTRSKAAANRALQGHLFTRVDLQARGLPRRRSRRASSRRTSASTAPAAPSSTGDRFQCHLKGGHGSVDMRHAIETVLQRVLLHARQHARCRSDPQVGDRSRSRREINGIDLPNELLGLVPSTEWKAREEKEKWYAGETISVAIGQGQVNVTPMSHGGDDDDARQRRHPLYAASSLKAVDDGKGWEPFAPPPPRSASPDEGVGRNSRRFATGCGSRSTAPAPPDVPASKGHDVAGKTGTAQPK